MYKKMKLKRIITQLCGFVGRGFRYERFDHTHLENSVGLLDYCVVLRLVPTGFRWKKVRMVIGGPVSATGTLELFTRHIRTEGSRRYTVTYMATPNGEDRPVTFAVPVVGDRSNIGIVGIYYTLEDGTEHNYITRQAVTVARGKMLDINVPAPQQNKEYVKPTVTVLEGEDAEEVKRKLAEQ